MSSSHHSHKNCQEAEETEGITSIMVWERNAIYCSPTPIPERAKKLKNWWRNKGKKRRNDISAQMSFLGTQCWHSDILNSSTISKAIRHMTIPSESLECGLSACQVPTWIRSFPMEIFHIIQSPALAKLGHPTCTNTCKSSTSWCRPTIANLGRLRTD